MPVNCSELMCLLDRCCHLLTQPASKPRKNIAPVKRANLGKMWFLTLNGCGQQTGTSSSSTSSTILKVPGHLFSDKFILLLNTFELNI